MAMTRTQSGREVRRQTYAPYISRSHSEKGSEHTGLTKYMSNTSLSFGEDELFTEDTKKLTKHISKDVNDVLGQTPPSFSRASFLLQKPKSEKAHVSIDMWKPTPDERFGITFETLRDKSIKGIVVADIQSEGLAARSKKLKVGDMLHAINGQAVSTPQAAATLLREAKGVVQLVITRANPMPRQREGDIGLIKSDTTNGEQGAKAEEEPGSNTTVVVSCSALILASKEIVSHAGGLAERLDELYHQLKAKEIKSAAALQQLGELVGQTTIEQAGLVIANAQLGTLPNGWVEYYDQENGRPCMLPSCPHSACHKSQCCPRATVLAQIITTRAPEPPRGTSREKTSPLHHRQADRPTLSVRAAIDCRGGHQVETRRPRWKCPTTHLRDMQFQRQSLRCRPRRRWSRQCRSSASGRLTDKAWKLCRFDPH